MATPNSDNLLPDCAPIEINWTYLPKVDINKRFNTIFAANSKMHLTHSAAKSHRSCPWPCHLLPHGQRHDHASPQWHGHTPSKFRRVMVKWEPLLQTQHISGWWYTYLWKIMEWKSMGRMTSHIWNGKQSSHVWNHQPDMYIYINICIPNSTHAYLRCDVKGCKVLPIYEAIYSNPQKDRKGPNCHYISMFWLF